MCLLQVTNGWSSKLMFSNQLRRAPVSICVYTLYCLCINSTLKSRQFPGEVQCVINLIIITIIVKLL